MKIKNILLWILLVTIGGGVSFWKPDLFWRNHVSVGQLDSPLFERISDKNERILYDRREKIDPSFRRWDIIPYGKTPLDIVIPLVEKDCETVPYTVRSIRNLVGHPIGTIYFVSPESQKIRELAHSLGCTFILEDTVLPDPAIKKHRGWIIQQFLKLNADSFVKNQHYLVVDADTLFLRPIIFTLKDGTYLVNIHWMTAVQRKKMTSILLGNNKVFKYDFVSHYMLFSKSLLSDMKKHIEGRFGKRWDKAIVDLFAKGTPETSSSNFSEYDLYVTYVTECSKEKFRFISSANVTVYRNFLSRLDAIIPAYAPQYKSISLHHFMVTPKGGPE
jgi:hypothetical protein